MWVVALLFSSPIGTPVLVKQRSGVRMHTQAHSPN